jgi:hypothetical protein
MVTINDTEEDAPPGRPQEDLWEVAPSVGVELPRDLLIEAADDAQLFSKWKVHAVRQNVFYEVAGNRCPTIVVY